MTALNSEIADDKVRLGLGYRIGHSFFVPSDGAQPLDAAWYRRTVQHEIAPLLREYWFDNPEAAETWTASFSRGLIKLMPRAVPVENLFTFCCMPGTGFPKGKLSTSPASLVRNFPI